MNSSNFAKSSLSSDPILYFSKQLDLNMQEIQELIQYLHPIEAEDIGEGEMSEIDTYLLELSMYMMLCYQKSLPNVKVTEDQKNNTTKCMRHPEKNLNFVCINVECPIKFFCMKCRKEHANKCSRAQLITAPQIFDDPNFHEEYHEVDEGQIDIHIQKIDDFGDKLKESFKGYVDVMVKHWKNEILTLSKEPMLKFARTKLLESLKAYKGKQMKRVN